MILTYVRICLFFFVHCSCYPFHIVCMQTGESDPTLASMTLFQSTIVAASSHRISPRSEIRCVKERFAEVTVHERFDLSCTEEIIPHCLLRHLVPLIPSQVCEKVPSLTLLLGKAFGRPQIPGTWRCRGPCDNCTDKIETAFRCSSSSPVLRKTI